jgi:hypothetical protein
METTVQHLSIVVAAKALYSTQRVLSMLVSVQTVLWQVFIYLDLQVRNLIVQVWPVYASTNSCLRQNVVQLNYTRE